MLCGRRPAGVPNVGGTDKARRIGDPTSAFVYSNFSIQTNWARARHLSLYCERRDIVATIHTWIKCPGSLHVSPQLVKIYGFILPPMLKAGSDLQPCPLYSRAFFPPPQYTLLVYYARVCIYGQGKKREMDHATQTEQFPAAAGVCLAASADSRAGACNYFAMVPWVSHARSIFFKLSWTMEL